uniref:DUF4346 domain-containing protein n=1 Tax=Platysiphonia delicata TaxID=2006979 RepID=A0A1Z1M101_9FLOR|nr:hypothetical protein [Platysiphonia delicata]ARW59552.1 hypothetical protein [Platysiphonia delicata]
MDSSYFLIRVTEKNKIEVYYIKSKKDIFIYNYPICFIGCNIKIIYSIINLYEFSNSLSIVHLLYLGKELFKIEISSFTLQDYVQE